MTSAKLSGHTVYAHNAGKFDYLCLFGNLFTFFGADHVIMAKGRFIQANYENNRRHTVFRDSLNLFNCSLAKIGKELFNEKLITPDKFKNRIRQPVDAQDIQYCQQDCKILYDALMQLKRFTGDIKATTASTAMSVFRQRYLQSNIWIRHEADYYFRQAYYGGRVEAYKIGILPQTYYYDINSLYPYSMTFPLPNPSKLFIVNKPNTHRLISMLDKYEGMATITVQHKQHRIGFLPYRLNHKLVFPVGTFTGSYCFPEIRNALNAGVIAILDCSFIAASKPMASPFTQYVLDFYGMKQQAKGIQRENAKLMLNGLYGKFAEHHSQDIQYGKRFDFSTFKRLQQQYEFVSWKPISSLRSDGYYILNRKEAFTPHSIYSWASYITSIARTINIQQQLRIMQNSIDIFYTDTDSFTISKPLPAQYVSNALGALKLENKVMRTINGNKDYKYLEAEAVVTSIKGVPHSAKQIDEHTFSYGRLIGLREGIRRNRIGEPVEVRKHLRRIYDKRIVMRDGSTVPLTLPIIEDEQYKITEHYDYYDLCPTQCLTGAK